MIIKKIKFVFLVLFLLVGVFPSYCALDSSDGSAFVTKEEFDNALADFNARLTVFEAGINSKIDTQVSSYLDRNGIWSAEKQVFDWTEKSWWVPLADTGMHKDWYFAYQYKNYTPAEATGQDKSGEVLRATTNDMGWTTGTGTVMYPVKAGRLFEQMCIHEITKSGMIMIDLELLRETLVSNYTANSGTNYKYSNIAKYWRTNAATRKTKALSDPAFLSEAGNGKFNYLYSSSGTDNEAASPAGRSEVLILKACGKVEGDTYIADATQVPNWRNKWMYNTLNMESPGLIITNETRNWYASGKALQWNAIFFVDKGDQLWVETVWNKYGKYPDSFATSNTAASQATAAHGQGFLIRFNSANVY